MLLMAELEALPSEASTHSSVLTVLHQIDNPLPLPPNEACQSLYTDLEQLTRPGEVAGN